MSDSDDFQLSSSEDEASGDESSEFGDLDFAEDSSENESDQQSESDESDFEEAPRAKKGAAAKKQR